MLLIEETIPFGCHPKQSSLAPSSAVHQVEEDEQPWNLQSLALQHFSRSLIHASSRTVHRHSQQDPSNDCEISVQTWDGGPAYF